MRVRDLFLDEDCNRCEGDIPDAPKQKIPTVKSLGKDLGSADLVEEDSIDVEKTLEELLGR